MVTPRGQYRTGRVTSSPKHVPSLSPVLAPHHSSFSTHPLLLTTVARQAITEL